MSVPITLLPQAVTDELDQRKLNVVDLRRVGNRLVAALHDQNGLRVGQLIVGLRHWDKEPDPLWAEIGLGRQDLELIWGSKPQVPRPRFEKRWDPLTDFI